MNDTLDTFGSSGFTIYKDDEHKDVCKKMNNKKRHTKKPFRKTQAQPRKRALKRRMALHDVSNTRSKTSHVTSKKAQHVNDEMDIESHDEFFPTQTERLKNENRHLQSKIKQLTNQVQSLQHEIFMSTKAK